MDSHRPDISFLPVYRRRVNGAVVCGAARAWRLAAVAYEARGPAERADSSDRLRHSHPSLRRLLPYALSRSLAADRRGVSVRVGRYTVDLDSRPRHLDCRAARRLLRRHAVRPRTGMRS